MAKELHCPNCGAACVPKEDGSTVCPSCGGTFHFKEGEAHLVDVGEYDRLKGKVNQLEAGQAELRELLGKPAAKPDDPSDPSDPTDPTDPEDEDEDDDEEDW